MAHPDLDELLNALLPFAQEMLSKQGEFFPFGATMKSDGSIASAAGDAGGEHPPSQEVIDLLLSGFRDQASKGEIKAAGVCLHVRISPPGSGTTDAVCARLEHSTGETVEVYLPYKKGMFGRLKFGKIFAGPGENQVFDKAAT
ncbi:MAG: hypothetical protein R3D98_10830 [Candidatus Krumholzibacteriia bacterium]